MKTWLEGKFGWEQPEDVEEHPVVKRLLSLEVRLDDILTKEVEYNKASGDPVRDRLLGNQSHGPHAHP